MDTTIIVDAFRLLPQESRVELLCQLWDQVVDDGWMPPLDDDRKAELNRRWVEFAADRSKGLTWNEVLAHARRRQ